VSFFNCSSGHTKFFDRKTYSIEATGGKSHCGEKSEKFVFPNGADLVVMPKVGSPETLSFARVDQKRHLVKGILASIAAAEEAEAVVYPHLSPEPRHFRIFPPSEHSAPSYAIVGNDMTHDTRRVLRCAHTSTVKILKKLFHSILTLA